MKEIQTTFLQTENILESLFCFFSKQKQIEVVTLTLADIKEQSLKRLVFYILKECSNLRELRLSYPLAYELILNNKEFSEFLKSPSLKALQLRFNVGFTNVVASPVKNMLNRNLQCLVIDSHHSFGENDYSEIIKYFSNLQHLEMCFVTDKVLQTVFEYQVRNHSSCTLCTICSIFIFLFNFCRQI